MYQILSEQKGTFIEELMCPSCYSELHEISKHILYCPGCSRGYGQLLEGEGIAPNGECKCPRCDYDVWAIVKHTGNKQPQVLQCPLCEALYEFEVLPPKQQAGG